MHAFLVTGKTKEARLTRAKQILEELGLKEIVHLAPDNSKHLISSVRNLNSSLQISPLDREKGRGVIFDEANLLTQDAANAFLKTLEEPPPGNYLVLTAPTRESVLETIASRTAQIDLGAPDLNLDSKSLDQAKDDFGKLSSGSVGEKFTFVDSLKDRESALTFVVGQIYIVREIMLSGVLANFNSRSQKLAGLLDSLDKTRVYLEANVNVKLALSELVLQYPSKNWPIGYN